MERNKVIGSEWLSTFPQSSLEISGRNGSWFKKKLSHYSPLAGDLLNQLQDPGKQKHINIVKFPLMKIGFSLQDYYADMEDWTRIENAVRGNGLDLCPQLTAAEMIYLNASIIGKGEEVYILCEPIVQSNGFPGIFGLYRDRDKLNLFANHASNVALDLHDFVVAQLP